MKKELLFKQVNPILSYVVLVFFFVSSVLLYISYKGVLAVDNINDSDSAGWQQHLE
jgi:hypothetical protein